MLSASVRDEFHVRKFDRHKESRHVFDWLLQKEIGNMCRGTGAKSERRAGRTGASMPDQDHLGSAKRRIESLWGKGRAKFLGFGIHGRHARKGGAETRHCCVAVRDSGRVNVGQYVVRIQEKCRPIDWQGPGLT